MSGPCVRRSLISVVIPTFNSSAYIDHCLDSVFGQRGDFGLDVIVVDDGSTDDTVRKVRSRHGVRCLAQVHRGPAAARNLGLDQARGEYIAFLDSDDLWPPGKLADQLYVLQRQPGMGLVFGDCRQFDHRGPFAQTLFEELGANDEYWGDPVTVVNPYARLIANNFITTGSVVMRRSCVERVGRFAEGLNLVEDLDYWLRAALVCPLGHVDTVCLLRRRHGNNASRDAIAMSLAYLEVLESHRRRYGSKLTDQGADLDLAVSREYEHLGHLYQRKGNNLRAVGAFLRSLRQRVALRPVYYMVLAILAAAGFKREP